MLNIGNYAILSNVSDVYMVEITDVLENHIFTFKIIRIITQKTNKFKTGQILSTFKNNLNEFDYLEWMFENL